jgi:amino acid transporter
MTEDSKKTPGLAKKQGTLGTFAGVFTPSILTILGIILFLRLGFVVGGAGLRGAIIILLLANGISILTTFSLSAISTNIRVKGGGDYYLISRTLGLEFGGAIGIVLFLAQSVSIGFYCIGFGEVMAGIVSTSHLKIFSQVIAASAVGFLFIFAWLGADWATRFQYVVMSILGAALISFLVGGLEHWNHAILVQNWPAPENGLPFWTLFAIFFPAVTGFTQGVSMSGDLKDPGKSLPLGTFLAVGISIAVYFGAAVIFAGSLPNIALTSNYTAMKSVAAVNFIIDGGVIAATLSSAMASFLGAPRILQSLSSDRIFKFLLPFAKGAGPLNNPRRGVLLSAGIAFATIGLGQLNMIAPVVSMFFLISYGLLNYATYYEARAESPSFRPRFRFFDKRLSLLGGLFCLATMLAIDLKAGIVAITVLFSIYQYLKRTAGPARWADSRRSYHLQQVREHLLAAAAEPEHARDWRPHILLFSESHHHREQLLDFANWLQGSSGFTTAVQILEGYGLKMLKLREKAEAELRADIQANDLAAFPLVLAVPNFTIGVHTLVQVFGIGPLHANTVLLNWYEQLPQGDPKSRERLYGQHLRTAHQLGKNIVVLDAKADGWEDVKSIPPEKRRIDVWWWDDATSRLMLLLAYLITRSKPWEDTKIRVLAACFSPETNETVEDLRLVLEEVRIEAQPEVVIKPNPDAVVAYSSDASIVFLPFRFRGNQPVDPFDGSPEDILSRLTNVVMVLAAEDIDLDAEPEEGEAGEMAALFDALTDARKKAAMAEKEAKEASALAEEKMQRIQHATLSEMDENEFAALKKEMINAKQKAIEAARKAAKATVKADDAEQAALKAGVKLTDKDNKK